MEFLYFLERIRIPTLNEFMLGITYFGDEIAFLVTALGFFWCVDKKKGYYILAVGFVGTVINQFLKLLFRIPRPWVKDPKFTILEQAREAATGYSFPSGHTQNSVGTFGTIACTIRDKRVRIPAIALCVLVPLSRMYIGVHTPADILVAAAIAIVLIFVIRPAIFNKDGKYIPVLLGIMSVLAIALLYYVEFFPFPADVDKENLASGIKNAYTLTGALFGLLIVYVVDEKWMHFPVKAVWWAQLVKVVLGLALVMAVKIGMKEPLNMLLGESVGRAARYFLMVLVAGALWPLTFKKFEKLGAGEKS